MVMATEAARSFENNSEPMTAKTSVAPYIQTSSTAAARARIRLDLFMVYLPLSDGFRGGRAVYLHPAGSVSLQMVIPAAIHGRYRDIIYQNSGLRQSKFGI